MRQPSTFTRPQSCQTAACCFESICICLFIYSVLLSCRASGIFFRGFPLPLCASSLQGRTVTPGSLSVRYASESFPPDDLNLRHLASKFKFYFAACTQAPSRPQSVHYIVTHRVRSSELMALYILSTYLPDTHKVPPTDIHVCRWRSHRRNPRCLAQFFSQEPRLTATR